MEEYEITVESTDTFDIEVLEEDTIEITTN
jgi:hypothetical protein